MVRTVIDLRGPDETARQPSPFAIGDVAYRCIPLWGEDRLRDHLPNFTGGYWRELDQHGPQLAQICRTVLEDGVLPVLIHCTAGKDRTGLVVALLLAVSRVWPESIVEDYALSAVCLGDDYIEAGRRWLASRGGSWARYGHLFTAPPERMRQTLQHLERHWGGADAYLIRQGFTSADVGTLRQRLTAPAERPVMVVAGGSARQSARHAVGTGHIVRPGREAILARCPAAAG
jgi:protein-tyrosine phosphatase